MQIQNLHLNVKQGPEARPPTPRTLAKEMAMARNRNQAVKRARELSKQRKIEDKRAKKEQKKSGVRGADSPPLGGAHDPAAQVSTERGDVPVGQPV